MKAAAMLVCFVAGAACAAQDAGAPAITSLLVVHGPVSTGATAAAVFRNQTGSPVVVGDLGCLAEVDVLTHGDWEAIPGEQVCPAFGLGVANGDSLAFTFRAPAAAGVYRLRASASVDEAPNPGWNDLSLRVALLQSAPFEVRE